MICDKELELFDKKAVLGEAVDSAVVELGNTRAAEPCVLVISGSGLAGGTGLTVTLKTADDSGMANAVTVGVYEADMAGKPLVQVKLPYGCKRFIQATVTPSGAFTAGAIDGNIVWGPELRP